MLVRWYIIHTKTDNDAKLFRHRNSTKTGLQLLGGVLLESVPCEARKKDQPDQGAPVGPAAGHAAEDPGRRCSRVQHRPLVDSHWQAQSASPRDLCSLTMLNLLYSLHLTPYIWMQVGPSRERREDGRDGRGGSLQQSAEDLG